MSDGYYYRMPGCAVPEGPCTRRDIDLLLAKGEIDARTKCWKTAGGNIYQVELGRRFTVGGLFSCISCGHLCELLMIIFTFSATMFSMTLLDWHNDKERGARIFLVTLAAITCVLVVLTIAKVGGRWQRSSSEAYMSEV